MITIDEIRNKIIEMSVLTLRMWQEMHLAFMEHKRELLDAILNMELRLNAMEKEIMNGLAELGKHNLADKVKMTSYAEIAGDLELIGDYCKDILERVEIKIEEKLLFSNDAVRDYEELYRLVEENMIKVVQLLKQEIPIDKSKDIILAKELILRKLNMIRKNHDERLISGKCNPLASNMFLNIVDFTGAVYNHIKNIAVNLSKLK